MSLEMRRTVYFKPKLYRALKLKAASTDKNISELVNQAVTFALREDALDLQAIAERKKESSKSFEAVLKGLKRDKLL